MLLVLTHRKDFKKFHQKNGIKGLAYFDTKNMCNDSFYMII